MHRRLFAIVALALLLTVMSSGLASADDSKSINGLHGSYAVYGENTPFLCLYWRSPTKTPLAKNSYRVDWSLNKKGFRSHKQTNTYRAGHYYINKAGHTPYSNACWDIGSYFAARAVLKWPVGQTLRVRIRARYSGKNGDWTKLSITRTADGYTSDDISITNLSTD